MDGDYVRGMFDVSGRVVVLTGGGGVLCGTMARALARAGARVALLDLSLEAAEAVAGEIRGTGGEAMAVQADVLSKESLEAAAVDVERALGPVEVLINGAGGNRPQATTSPELSFFDLPEDAFQWVFSLNFIGTLLPTQVFGRGMAERGEGCIVNIASINAFRPLTKIPAYSAAKAAVRNFTEWLAVHVAQEYSPRIRVNAIAPGFFLTSQNRYLLIDERTGQATPRGRQVLDHTPQGRYGDPEDLVSTLFWLLSARSGFVHGTTIVVDGGFNAYSGV